jgi:hypothetical protein
MNRCLGIAISSDHVHAVLVEGPRAAWAIVEPIDQRELCDVLTHVLEQAPARRRDPVAVAVGPSGCQLRRIDGLPPVSDPVVLQHLVQESANRFFLQGTHSLRVSTVRIVGSGSVWAAAAEEPIVHAVEMACAAQRRRLEVLVPSVVAIARLEPVEDGAFTIIDGGIRVEAEASRGLITSLRRMSHSGPPPDDNGSLPTQLSDLGEGAAQFAGAWCATRVRPTDPLVFPRTSQRGDVPVRRIARAGVTLLVAGLFAASAPGVVAHFALANAEARLRDLGPERSAAMAQLADLRRVSLALAEIEDFVATRRERTIFIADLATRLPAGSAILDFQLDSLSGSMTIVAPTGSPLLAGLDSDGIRSPAITGPVVRHDQGDAPTDRYNVRFRLSPLSRDGEVLP